MSSLWRPKQTFPYWYKFPSENREGILPCGFCGNGRWILIDFHMWDSLSCYIIPQNYWERKNRVLLLAVPVEEKRGWSFKGVYLQDSKTGKTSTVSIKLTATHNKDCCANHVPLSKAAAFSFFPVYPSGHVLHCFPLALGDILYKHGWFQ